MFFPSLWAMCVVALVVAPLFMLLRLFAWLLFDRPARARELLGWLWVGCFVGLGLVALVQGARALVHWQIFYPAAQQEMAVPTGAKRKAITGLELEVLLQRTSKVQRALWVSQRAALSYLRKGGPQARSSQRVLSLEFPIVRPQGSFFPLLVGEVGDFNLALELQRAALVFFGLLGIVILESFTSKYLRFASLLLRYLWLKFRMRRPWLLFSLRRRIWATKRSARIIALLFTALARMGKASGKLQASEREVLLEIADRQSLGLSTNEKIEVLRALRRPELATKSLPELIAALIEVEKLDRALRPGLYEMLLSMALADSVVSAQEQSMLDQIASVLGLGAIKARQIRACYECLLQLEAALAEFQMPELEKPEASWGDFAYGAGSHGAQRAEQRDSQAAGPKQGQENARQHASAGARPQFRDASQSSGPYLILGIPSSASLPMIKAAYRRMALKYHPDRSAYSGVSPEVAQDRFRQVQEAYEEILAVRGSQG